MTQFTYPQALFMAAVCSAVTLFVTHVALGMSTPHEDPYCKPGALSAKVVRVKDGDTMILRASLGLDVYRDVNVRLLGVDTPETRGAQRPAGLRAKTFTTDWLLRYGNSVVLHEDGLGKYGRVLGKVCPPDGGECLSEALVKAGHVK